MLRTQLKSVRGTFMVDTLVTAFADPHQPQGCAQCLIACIDNLLGAHFEYNMPVLRSKHPELYDAFVRFITVSRPDGELIRLEEAPGPCRCNLTDRRLRALHQYNTGACTWPRLGGLMETYAMNAINTSEGRLYKVEKRQQRAALQRKSAPWPQTPDDVLPYGIDASVHALAGWGDFVYGAPCHLGFLTSIISRFKKAAVPPILASPTIAGDIIRIARKPFLEIPRKRAGPPEHRAFNLVRMVQDIKCASFCFESLLNHFDKDELRALACLAVTQVGDGPDVSFVYVCNLAVEVLPSFIEGCKDINMSNIAEDLERCLTNFRLVGSAFHIYLDLPLDSSKYSEYILCSVRGYREEKDTECVYLAAHDGLLMLWKHSRCWAPGCRATCVVAQRPFAACTGCSRVTYCSKECQVRAWRHPDVPHQAICRTIKYIVDTTHLPPTPMLPHREAMKEIFVSNGVDWLALIQFRDHMDMLQKHTTLAPSLEPAEGSLLPTSFVCVLIFCGTDGVANHDSQTAGPAVPQVPAESVQSSTA